jgi:hypothetical protein
MYEEHSSTAFIIPVGKACDANAPISRNVLNAPTAVFLSSLSCSMGSGGSESVSCADSSPILAGREDLSMVSDGPEDETSACELSEMRGDAVGNAIEGGRELSAELASFFLEMVFLKKERICKTKEGATWSSLVDLCRGNDSLTQPAGFE